MRKRVYLNGFWDYKIGNGEYSKKQVPFSSLTVGKSECKRFFDMPNCGERHFLVFEGITYAANVYLNGVHLGYMRAYGEYKFEITTILKDRNNEVVVELEDINVDFGPSEGWENYGGIIRDVYIECCGKYVIEDAFFYNDVDVTKKSARCNIEIESDIPKGSEYRCILADYDGKVIGEYIENKKNISFAVENVKLWSPDEPNLYTLYIETEFDIVSFKVGFKKFEKRGRQFYLNGEKFFLFGVCRHDLYGAKGHTVSYSEMYEDMKKIKDTGVNFVRLVHYPHNKKIIEIADELGLLVSEEPGLWWSDMKNEEICKGSLEILKNVIIRDRSHVSVAFWLSFNECIFTKEFIMDSAHVARENDHTRMVSGANCMTLEMTKENFKKYGFDFYTMHPYTTLTKTYHEFAEFLDDMPLVFTEWGGTETYDAPRFLNECIKNMEQLYAEGKLAGASYWEWSKIYEFCRGEEACQNGVLCESLVDFDRNPTLIYDTFKNAADRIKNGVSEEKNIKVLPLCVEEGKYTPVDITARNNENEWEEMIEKSKIPIKKFYTPRGTRRTKSGPILPENIEKIGNLPVKLLSKPLVISKKEEIEINDKASGLYFIGNVSMPDAYPISGEMGDVIGRYRVIYKDGTEDEYILRNGMEITTAFMLFGPSRINPVCPNANRVIEFSYDYDFEQYIVNCMSIKTDEKKIIDRLVCETVDGKNILIYGITKEK